MKRTWGGVSPGLLTRTQGCRTETLQLGSSQHETVCENGCNAAQSGAGAPWQQLGSQAPLLCRCGAMEGGSWREGRVGGWMAAEQEGEDWIGVHEASTEAWHGRRGPSPYFSSGSSRFAWRLCTVVSEGVCCASPAVRRWAVCAQQPSYAKEGRTPWHVGSAHAPRSPQCSASAQSCCVSGAARQLRWKLNSMQGPKRQVQVDSAQAAVYFKPVAL